MNLTICIRTHDRRLYLANDLKAMCERAFPQGTRTFLCNNGSPSPFYSELFYTNLHSWIPTVTTEYILIMEDDIILSESAVRAVSCAIDRGDTHNWYTVDTTSDILKKSTCVPGFGYLLASTRHISYSGAILARAVDLRECVEDFFLNGLERDVPNFDINFSAHLMSKYSHLHLRPGHFLQRPNIETSVIYPQRGRKVYDPSETFLYIGPEV